MNVFACCVSRPVALFMALLLTVEHLLKNTFRGAYPVLRITEVLGAMTGIE
jgi:hypothetical protein